MNFVLDSSLALYLPLYELDGSSFASRDGCGHICTVTGALWTPQGRSFDGSDDYIEIPASSSSPWNFGTGEFAMEAWFKNDGWGGGTDIIFNIGRDTTKRGTLFGFNNSGNPRLWWSDSLIALWDINNLSFGVSNVSSDAWHHVVYQRAGNILYCYIDGVATGTTFDVSSYSSLAWDNAGSDFAIGCSLSDAPGTQSEFEGLVGEVRVYKRSLTFPEIQRNYLATKWRYQ